MFIISYFYAVFAVANKVFKPFGCRIIQAETLILCGFAPRKYHLGYIINIMGGSGENPYFMRIIDSGNIFFRKVDKLNDRFFFSPSIIRTRLLIGFFPLRSPFLRCRN